MIRLGSDDGILYLDRSEDGMFIITRKSQKTVFTGISLHSEPAEARKRDDILKRFQKEDFYPFFDDETPHLNMYAVPILLIFGHDSRGGYFATTDSDISYFTKSFPLYYISCESDVYKIDADSMLLISGELDWKAHLIPTDAVKIYSSRQMAEKDYWIHDIGEVTDRTSK